MPPSASGTGGGSSGWTPPTVEELHELLPQYEIDAILGQGGMGAVYKGRQGALQRPVAIKVLPETLAEGDDDHQYVERFKLEARSMANLDHPAIISVYDFGQTSAGQLYFVMEFIDGMDIEHYIAASGGKVDPEHAIAIVSHVLDALEYAHSKGIVHRDIKPANVLINSEGKVKIADFGLAKQFGGEAAEMSGLTMTNMAMGTPDYIAPEALEMDRAPDHRADLYAVGVMLYKMLTGKLPRGMFKLPSEEIPGLDERFDDIIALAMESNPDGRYQGATEFRGQLNDLLTRPITKIDPEQDTAAISAPAERLQFGDAVSGATPLSGGDSAPAAPAASRYPPKKPVASKRGPGLMIGMAAAACLIIGVIVFAATRGGDKPVESPASTAFVPTEPDLAKKSSPKAKSVAPKALAESGSSKGPLNEPPATSKDPSDRPTGPNLASAGNSPPPPSVTQTETESTKTPEPQTPAPPEPTTVLALPSVQSRIANYQKARSQALLVTLDGYRKALDSEKSKATSSGNLEHVEAADAAIVHADDLRVQIQSLPDTGQVTPLLSQAPSLAASSPNVDRLLGILAEQVGAREAEFLGKLDQSLQTAESDFVKRDEIEKARMVKDYRGELQTLFKQSPSAAPTSAVSSAPASNAPSQPAAATGSLTSASKSSPFENGLGMRFVPVPITGGPTGGKIVLFSIWETRVQDYEAFVEDDPGRSWDKPTFEQGSDHPAVRVSWEDAVAFCDWLTEKDQASGLLPPGIAYRLPSDHEWSCAIGIGRAEDPELPPYEKSEAPAGRLFPWGSQWPPPEGSGNLKGQESGDGPTIPGYRDEFPTTAPVGSYDPNHYGLFDLEGNVREWCQDWLSPQREKRVIRGAAWNCYTGGFVRSANRKYSGLTKMGPSSTRGFRVVLSDTGPVESTPAAAPAPLPDMSGPEWHALFAPEGVGEWKTFGVAKWSFANGVLSFSGVKSDRGQVYRPIDSHWFELVGEVEWNAMTNTAILFHSMELPEGIGPKHGSFLWQLGGSRGPGVRVFGCGGLNPGASAPVKTKFDDFPDNQRLPFRLLVTADRVSAWIDGIQTLDQPLKVGEDSTKLIGFAFNGGSTDFRFYNLRIRYLDGSGRPQ